MEGLMNGRCRGWVLGLLAVALSGCLGFIEPEYLLPSKRVEKVRETADLYGQLLRFGRVAEAAAMVRSEDRKAFIEAFATPHQRVQFANAEVVTVEPVDLTTVEVWTHYEVFAPPSLRVRTLTERQLWHFDGMRRSWLVQPDLAVFPGAQAQPAPSPAPAG
jgi:hypothetical protein